MPRPRLAIGAATLAFCIVASPGWHASAIQTPPGSGQSLTAAQPAVTLRRAPRLRLPGPADSNSPAVWTLIDGLPTLSVMTSVDGTPSLASGVGLTRLGEPRWVHVDGSIGGVWMEALVAEPDGVWYGFYHNELKAQVCGETTKMTPHIGAARSTDHGATWRDLGRVLEMPSWAIDCITPNRYFTGGVGDFSVVLDAGSTYLYIFYSQYPAKLRGQGVAVARLPWADRDAPTGRALVWRDEGWVPARQLDPEDENAPPRWTYPIGTPIYRAAESWHDDDETVDAFWGPSVHWNTYLERYVMLLNRARDVEWTNEGIYIAFAGALDQPASWSAPTRIIEGGRWYPQIIGLESGSGTDRLAGQLARFFMSGESDHLIQFARPGESDRLETTTDR